jgi:DNA-binding PadR family transcriptional regulator
MSELFGTCPVLYCLGRSIRLKRGAMASASPEKTRWMRGPSTPLRGALLGLLLERPGHGGDLANRLAVRLGETWRVDTNDVYRLLEQLEKTGLAVSRDEPKRNNQRRTHLVYYPTEETPEALTLWMETAGEAVGGAPAGRAAAARSLEGIRARMPGARAARLPHRRPPALVDRAVHGLHTRRRLCATPGRDRLGDPYPKAHQRVPGTESVALPPR